MLMCERVITELVTSEASKARLSTATQPKTDPDLKLQELGEVLFAVHKHSNEVVGTGPYW